MGVTVVTVRHDFPLVPIHVPTLCDDLAARLGRAVDLVTRRRSGDDPGVLIVQDRATGQRLDVDPAVLAGVVSAHIPPPARRSSGRQALDEFDVADTPTGKLLALRNHIARQVEADETRRDLRKSAP